MYECNYICVYCVYVHLSCMCVGCVCLYICVCVCVYAYVYMHICVCACACIHICVCMCMCMHMCICIYVCACMCMHMCVRDTSTYTPVTLSMCVVSIVVSRFRYTVNRTLHHTPRGRLGTCQTYHRAGHCRICLYHLYDIYVEYLYIFKYM